MTIEEITRQLEVFDKVLTKALRENSELKKGLADAFSQMDYQQRRIDELERRTREKERWEILAEAKERLEMEGKA